MPDDAHLVNGKELTDVKTSTLKENDIILIKPGEKLAADGIISDGETYLNESMLTGESKPVKKNKGDKVIAGSINGNGSIKVTVAHGAKDSYLSQVIKLVYRKMVQNLILATGYNVVALPLAAGVLYNKGLLLSPAAGAVLMTISTVVVAINASMLKIKK